MQTRELDGPDLVIRLTWAESNFERIFGTPLPSNEIGRLEPGQD